MVNTPISLTSGQEYTVNFATQGSSEAGLLQFGWVYVSGDAGSATVSIVDQDGVARPTATVPTPGLFASVLRESSPPNVSKVVVKAGTDGFRGTFSFDLLPVTIQD